MHLGNIFNSLYIKVHVQHKAKNGQNTAILCNIVPKVLAINKLLVTPCTSLLYVIAHQQEQLALIERMYLEMIKTVCSLGQ